MTESSESIVDTHIKPVDKNPPYKKMLAITYKVFIVAMGLSVGLVLGCVLGLLTGIIGFDC